MVELLYIGLFLLGFVLIVKGGDLMVESSVWIAEITKIPAMVVGATIVSIATTFPETTIAFIASYSGQQELAINTAVGAMICNFTLVLGLSFMLMPTKIDPGSVAKRSVFFGAVLILSFLFALDKKISMAEGIILLIIFIVYLVFNLRLAKHEKGVVVPSATHSRPGLYMVLLQFVLSTIAIGFGASVLVSNVKNISEIIGISEEFIGLSFIALGTNIPEIVTTLTAVKKKNPEIGVGNIFGASLINATLLIGGSALLSPSRSIGLEKYIIFFSLPVLFLILLVSSLPIFRRGKSTRIQGFALLFIYLVYSIIMSIWL